MNVTRFVKVVSEMRMAQKAYFKSRLQRDLIMSKQWERVVDQAVQEGIVFDLDIEVRGEPESAQEILFTDDNDEEN